MEKIHENVFLCFHVNFKHSFHVKFPFSASFYSPLHHNGKGSVECNNLSLQRMSVLERERLGLHQAWWLRGTIGNAWIQNSVWFPILVWE